MTAPIVPIRSYSRGGKALVGCLVALGVLAVIAVIGVVFVVMNWRGWTADLIRAGTTEMINQADIPEGEKPEMIAHIDEYATAFEDGDISGEQFGPLMQELEQSSLFFVGTVYTIEQGYIQPSGLTDEEKQDGSLQLHRWARGIHENSIPRESIKDVAAPIGYEDQNGTFQFNSKESINDDMLREVIANAKTIADEAGVAEEDFVVDLSDELKRVLDESRSPAGSAPGSSGP